MNSKSNYGALLGMQKGNRGLPAEGPRLGREGGEQFLATTRDCRQELDAIFAVNRSERCS